jgi:transcriptional regulator with XRE-family HTH domain
MSELSLRQEFAKLIREWRIARGISQEGFSYRCGISRTYMTHIEGGKKMPSIDVVARLARGLEIEISAIFLELEKRGVTVERITDPPSAKW